MMIIKFKDGREIEFRQFGNIWLAETVIWDETELRGSMKELRLVKAKVTEWFDKNAPEEIREKYNARLPLWDEIEDLPNNAQLAHKEVKPSKIAEYLLGDEEYSHPIGCCVGIAYAYYGLFPYRADYGRSYSGAVRLCLEETDG